MLGPLVVQHIYPVMYGTAPPARDVYDSPISSVITNMRRTNVYRTSRGWFWELWIGTRLAVFGWAETEERAQMNARMA